MITMSPAAQAARSSFVRPKVSQLGLKISQPNSNVDSFQLKHTATSIRFGINKRDVRVGTIVRQGGDNSTHYEIKKVIGPDRDDGADPNLFVRVEVDVYEIRSGKPKKTASNQSRVIRCDGSYSVVRKKDWLERLADKAYGSG